MSANTISLHRVAYDTIARAFRAEVQFITATGVQRKGVEWHGPFTAEFTRVAGGLRDAALRIA